MHDVMVKEAMKSDYELIDSPEFVTVLNKLKHVNGFGFGICPSNHDPSQIESFDGPGKNAHGNTFCVTRSGKNNSNGSKSE
jgi:hypothetical protein